MVIASSRYQVIPPDKIGVKRLGKFSPLHAGGI